MSAKAKSKLTPEQQKATMTRVLQKIKPYGFFVVCSLIVAAVSVAAQLYIPILCGSAIDMMLGKGAVDFAGVLRIIYEIIVVAVVAAFAQWLLSVCNNRITFAVSRDLRNAAMRKIQTLPLSYLDSHPSGDIVSRMVADVDTFADGLLMGFTQLFSGVLTILGTLLFMLQQNVPITLVVVCITPLSLVVASFLAKRSYKYFQSQSTVRGEQTALVNEMIEGQKVVQAFGHEAQSLEAFDEVNGRLQNVSLKAIFFSSMTNPATRFVNNIVYAGVGLVGAIYAVAGGITIGQLSIFLNYANQYTKPFNEISGVVTELQNALACAARVFELLDAEDQTPEAENAAKLVPDGHVQIEDVSFRYLPDRPLIEGLSLDVKPGQRIAIVGPTGCGKTTLINLLMRFYDVNGGSIKVSGTDIRDVTRASLRGSYGMVLQDTWLRAGTVRENIAYGKPDAPLDEVVAAAKAAHADSFIRRLPEGYDTVIAEDGGKVAAFEKADGPQCRSGEYAVINGKVQAKWGRDTWTREQIDDIIDSHMVESTYRCKRSIMSKWAHNIGDAFDWWVEANPDLYYAETTRSAIPDENADNFIIPIFYPLPEHYDWKQERFPCYPTSVEFKPDQHVTVEANMQKAVDTGNVQTFYGCFVEKLIMDNGRCVGLYARDAATGEYIKCNASKGVILSTGDYSQNTKMLKHFCPEVIENNIQCLFTNVDVEGNFTNQGDGIQLGMWAGAQVQQSHAPMIHHMGGGADLAGVGVMGNAGFLNLDLNGKRFMNEDLPGQQLENQIELQKNRESWQIFDSNWPEQLPYMPAAHGGACYYEDYASEDEGPKNNTTYRNYKSPYQLEAAVADGRAVKADTLEELVAKIYPDDTAAQQTALDSIQRYNELAKAGYDEDFHKPASRMWAVENGPFYADKFTTALLLVCIGGLESDEDCHTFDADRNVIPGLYVAGNIQGSRFATEYPIGLKGVSHSMAMYYGYVAGKNALKDI